MSVTGYQGLPGSGKSYQVSSHVIVGAIRDGRRVVTNISGINIGAIQAYLSDQGQSLDSMGSLLYVDNDTIRLPNFWYAPDDLESIVQPGDVVIIDEAWEFFESGAAISPRVMSFFRYHRHYVHPKTNVACDIVLISQDIMDIGPKIRRVIEQTVSISKLKELGTDKAFRLEIYRKCALRGRPIYSEIGKYNPLFFTFYSSYEGKGDKATIGGVQGQERRVDSRGSLFQTPFFKYVMPLAIVGMIFLVWRGWSFFSDTSRFVGKPSEVDSIPTSSSELPPTYRVPKLHSQNPTHITVSDFASVSPDSASVSSDSEPVRLVESADYFVHGYYRSGDLYVVLVSSSGKRIILKNPVGFDLDMIRSEGVYRGEIVSTYTGGSGGFLSSSAPIGNIPGSSSAPAVPSFSH